MKDVVKEVKNFVIFDVPLKPSNINAQFTSTQQKLQAEVPGWSTTSTRQKVIANYWLTYVTGHFAFLLALPALLILFKYHGLAIWYIINVFVTGLLTYPIIHFFIYRPYFISTFLPHLETIKEVYERKETEQLEKCRKVQLSNQALCLIFFVFDKTSGMNTIQPNDKFAGVLMRLYGVDRGSLKANLELMMGSSGQRSSMTERRKTEIRNRFAEACQFFEDLEFSKGVKILEELELKFFGQLNKVKK